MILSFSACALAAIALLLLAANKRSDEGVCKGVLVYFQNEGKPHMLQAAEIKQLVEATPDKKLVGKLVKSIAIKELELGLESHPWVAEAELYFDNRNNLIVKIKEREPIARVFTNNNRSFFIDSNGSRLPISGKVGRLQVVTGFPSAAKWNAKDSAAFKDLKIVLETIAEDPFWNAQTGQIDITPDGFELITVVGDNIVRVGDAKEIDEKLHRAFVFYQQVLSRSGLNSYRLIDVQYKGQVVAVRSEASAVITQPVYSTVKENSEVEKKPVSELIQAVEKKKKVISTETKKTQQPNITGRKPKAVMKAKNEE